MPTQAPERALAELIPRAKGAYELDLRFSDVLAVAGRFDDGDPKIYHLSTHKFTASQQLVCAARANPFQYCAIARILRRPDTDVPAEMQVIEMTADTVTIRTAGIVLFRGAPDNVLVGGIGEPQPLDRAPDGYEGIRRLLHRFSPAT
jgi:hypothetical protein